MMMTQSAITTWFANNQDITQLVVGVFDYNGVLRGKRMPIAKLETILSSGFVMPLSIIQTDIWGRDITGSALLFETGDGDGQVILSDRLPLRLLWMAEPTALLIGHFVDASGAPHPVCPKGRLQAHQSALHASDMYPMAGVEMEFYLLADDSHAAPAPSLAMAKASPSGDTLSAHHLDDYDVLLSEIGKLCRAQQIALDTITSELGIGQFEITFAPKQDMVAVAEDILIFKYLVKGLAKAHGVRASFMAKPITGQAGNGMHVHMCVTDALGQNQFHDDNASGPLRLAQAVAGIMEVMQDSTLILAPHINSYRRLVPSSHAPTKICWGMDNRTASLRIPASDPSARRIEYRSAGADCNPYLLLAVMLASMAKGFDDALVPPVSITGNAYEQDIADLPCEMGVALVLFEKSEEIREILGAELHAYFADTKRQEWQSFADHVSAFEYDSLSHNL